MATTVPLGNPPAPTVVTPTDIRLNSLGVATGMLDANGNLTTFGVNADNRVVTAREHDAYGNVSGATGGAMSVPAS